MPESCREQIVLAIKARLEAIAGVSSLEVRRDETVAIASDELPILLLREGPERPREAFGGAEEWTLEIQIEGAAGGASVSAAASAAATLRAKVIAALCDNTFLGGLACDVRPAAEPLPALLILPADAPAKGWDWTAEIDYATAEGNPFQFA